MAGKIKESASRGREYGGGSSESRTVMPKRQVAQKFVGLLPRLLFGSFDMGGLIERISSREVSQMKQENSSEQRVATP